MVASADVPLLVILAVVAAASAALATRYRLAFRIALRNVRRGRVRTVLLMAGLLVGTTIISSSLVINDTVTSVNQHFVIQSFGYTDEGIYNESPMGGLAPFPLGIATGLAGAVASTPSIRGINPEIVSVTEAYNEANGIPETNLDLVGVNASASAALGSFTADDGTTLAGPAGGEVYLDDQATVQLGASVGDHLRLYGQNPSPTLVTVHAIVRDDPRGGFFFLAAGEAGNVFVDLPTAQVLVGFPATAINFIAVTNTGDLLAGAAASPAVAATLNASLAAMGAPAGLTVHQLLREGLASAAQSGQNAATIFFALGLFSIVAGAMLVVGIFVMLAEERVGEMGTLRAIGLRRRELVLIFFFEGLAYAAGSALAGTVVGVGVGFGLDYAFSVLLSGGAVSQSAILQSFTVNPDSLLLAYVAGFLLTLVTVAAASARAARLNIVRALRALPEPPPPIRVYTRIAYAGVPVALFGAIVLFTTARGATDVSLPALGGSILILGAALIGSRFLRNRVIFSAAGVALLVWNGFEPLEIAVLGSGHSGTIFVVFTRGIFLVLGAVLLYVFDADYLLTAITRLSGRSPRRSAVVRVGLAYPSRRPFRPAMTLTIFTLVVFTVVVVAVFADSLETNLNDSIEAQSGGYAFFGSTQTSVPDLAAQVRANTTLSPMLSEVVPLVGGGAFLNSTNWTSDAWGYPDLIHAAATGLAGAANFTATNGFTFAATRGGVDARTAWATLATDPLDAIVDGNYGISTPFGVGGVHPTLHVGDPLVVVDPSTGNVTTLTVGGILTGSIIPGVWLNPGTARALGYSAVTQSLFRVGPGVSTVAAAQGLKSAFFAVGLVLLDFGQVLAETIQSFQSVISLLEMFVALGLAVGIAAMGIVALRAVVERRREIGMLRAEGFRQRDIFGAFLLEYSFIALLGIGIGTGLGLWLGYDATTNPTAGLTFAVPWATVAIVVAVAYALTIVAIIGPSARAARLPPSEAVRYTE